MTSSPQQTQRYHPYTVHPSHTVQHFPQPYAQPAAGHSKHRRRDAHRLDAKGEYPPSPPRSRRDSSETPSVSLSMAFGANGGRQWWDQDLPPPPASLSSILDSFRKSGEGDRELLFSILGAKKAEEERLSALIHTRLTILQARLSLHQSATYMSAQVPPSSYHQVPVPDHGQPSYGSSRESCPSSSSPACGATTAVSDVDHVARRPSRPATSGYEKEGGECLRDHYWQLPSMHSSTPPSRTELPPLKEVSEYRERVSAGQEQSQGLPHSSPTEIAQSKANERSGNGLEMLLDVGMRRLETERQE